MDFFFAIVLAAVLIIPIGSYSYDMGKDDLCKKQFSGEMHDGKCVKVQREELK